MAEADHLNDMNRPVNLKHILFRSFMHYFSFCDAFAPFNSNKISKGITHIFSHY